MHATSDEVIPLHVPFEVVLRGFNRQQVLDHLESLDGRIEMIIADRDTALRQVADLSRVLDHLRRELEEATERVERLQRASLGGAGVRIQHLMQAAEDEITALQASTQQETTSLRERTRAEADRLLRETTRRCERLEAESERRRRTAEAESAARCRRAEQETERRCRLAEQQSQQEIARRQSEADNRIRQYQTRGVVGLHLLLRIVGEQLGGRLAEVEQEITRLLTLRAEVITQLADAHSALVAVVDQMQQPLVLESEEGANNPPRPALGSGFEPPQPTPHRSRSAPFSA